MDGVAEGARTLQGALLAQVRHSLGFCTKSRALSTFHDREKTKRALALKLFASKNVFAPQESTAGTIRMLNPEYPDLIP